MIHALLAVAAAAAKRGGGISLGTLIGIVGGILGIATLLGAAVVVLLRSTKNEIIADQTTRIGLLKDERSELAEKVANLEGRLAVLEGEFVDRIVDAVARAIAEHYSPPAPRGRKT